MEINLLTINTAYLVKLDMLTPISQRTNMTCLQMLGTTRRLVSYQATHHLGFSLIQLGRITLLRSAILRSVHTAPTKIPALNVDTMIPISTLLKNIILISIVKHAKNVFHHA